MFSEKCEQLRTLLESAKIPHGEKVKELLTQIEHHSIMDVAAFLPPEPFEPLPKCCEPLLPYGAGLRAMYQDADAPYPLALLRPRRERPRRCRAAKQSDELASLHLRGHSITSSASASSVGGTSSPSAYPS
jgi:hypothetical protein